MKKRPVILDFTDAQAVEALFNEAFQHPRRKYVVQPTNADQAAEWLKANTYMAHFTWCAGVKSFEQRLSEAGPLRCGELVHLDELYYRERCGWATGSYHCDYPGREDHPEHCHDDGCEECEELGQDEQGRQKHKRFCFAWNCPIAHEADREDIHKLDPELYRSDYKGNDDTPEDWMVLHSRPRYAYVPNVQVIGCEDVKRL